MLGRGRDADAGLAWAGRATERADRPAERAARATGRRAGVFALVLDVWRTDMPVPGMLAVVVRRPLEFTV